MRSILTRAAATSLLVSAVACDLIAPPLGPTADPPIATAELEPGGDGASPPPPTAVDCSHPGVLLAPLRRDLVAPATGILRDLQVTPGSRVEADEMLFRIEARDRDDDATRASAQARTMKAREAALLRRRQTQDRRAAEAESLGQWVPRSTRRASKEDAAAADADYRVATAERRAAEVDRAIARARLQPLQVRADAARRVVGQFAESGAHVLVGQPIVRVISLDPVELRFAVPEAVASQLAVGMQIRWRRPDVAEPPAMARITAISPELDAPSSLLLVQAQLAEAPESALPSGASVDVFVGTCSPAASSTPAAP